MPFSGNFERLVVACLGSNLFDAVELQTHQPQRVVKKVRFAAVQLAVFLVPPRRVFGGEMREEVELEASPEPLVQPRYVIASYRRGVYDVDLGLHLECAADLPLERDVIRSRQIHHLVIARAAERIRVDGCDVTKVRGRRVGVVVDEGQVAVAWQRRRVGVFVLLDHEVHPAARGNNSALMEDSVEEEEENVEDEPRGGEKFVLGRIFVLQGTDHTQGNHQRQDESGFLVRYEREQSEGNHQTAHQADLQQFSIGEPVSKVLEESVRQREGERTEQQGEVDDEMGPTGVQPVQLEVFRIGVVQDVVERGEGQVGQATREVDVAVV